MSAEDIRRLCRVPDVTRPDTADEIHHYASLLRRLRAEANRIARQAPAPRLRKCGNPVCPLPGGMFGPRHGEPYTMFRVRRFCSQRCGAIVSNAARAPADALPIKRCAYCRKLLTRREGEERRKFISRKYCDRRCQWNAQRGKPRAESS